MASTKVPYPEIRSRIQKFFEEDDLHFRPASNAWILDGRSITLEAMTTKCVYNLDINETRVKNTLKEWAAEEIFKEETALADWVKSLEKQPIDDAELCRWLILMQSEKTSKMMAEANLHAMRQWIWQIKRNIANQEVEWQVMPIFWSKAQGTGKSYNITKLLSPLKNFMKNISVSDVGEQFSDKQLSQSFVLFFDEFVGITKKQMALLKTVLTGRDFDRRGMHSENANYAKNRLSCIATTNEAPPHGYEDETGVRRIWSIEASSQPIHGASRRSAAFNGLDINKIWTCVSIDDPSPESMLSPELANFMLMEREGHLRARSPLESFCKDCLIKTKGKGDKVRFRDIRLAMNTYCSEHGLKKIAGDQKKICGELNKLGLETVSTGNVYIVLDCLLKDETKEDPAHLG